MKELKERRIIQNLFYYLVGALGLLASVYEICKVEKVRTLVLILCLTGVPIVPIVSYFHGSKRKGSLKIIGVLLVSACVITGAIFSAKTLMAPTNLTILIRMMEANERWFIENIIAEFEENNNCKVNIKRFKKDFEIIETLKREVEEPRSHNVSLVKASLPVTLILFKEGLVMSFQDILTNRKLKYHEIESCMCKIRDEYDAVTLQECSFNTISGNKLFFLPRKLETRMMIYRKRKVDDAVKYWRKFETEITDILKKENGHGLPVNFNLEPDADQWDYYDLFVAGYYWANSEDNSTKTGRIAHRSKDYEGTVLGLIDRALQLGSSVEDIRDMYKYSEGIVDMFQWEAIFRKYNLYSEGMWEEDGWSGSDIYQGFDTGSVYLAWMHQLDFLLICRSEQTGVKEYRDYREDLGIAIMPQGVSFELDEIGLPMRIGTRQAHTFGWFWGVPKNAPEPELAFDLAMFITSFTPHFEECKRFFLLPVKKNVCEALRLKLQDTWKNAAYTRSLEQLKINRGRFAPRFKTLIEYQEFLRNYYNAYEEIVIKRRYSHEGPEGKVDRNFIRDNLR